ncbi:Hypothetical protein R9X50_00556800 [Acrodontium crateriforme]|uniref:Lytic polysaccharide monooxygenase n=1 Tax=Acrodontium crateriforme TaxID=150365 RepID=A0AAQ3RAZ3_9PEZI|nr:Hypothetical protein R9X50_00556800 [Acrodontium crateriforme]
MTERMTRVLCALLWLLPTAFCHQEMAWPYSFRSRFNPSNNYTNIDYSMTSPLLADGSDFPCKGYQNDDSAGSVITYTAGQTYNISLSGTATHGGGSCQISLSFDNAATFHVVKSIIGGCPLTSKYYFTVPSFVPSGPALLAWTWQNYQGNREYYMNCAAVQITNGARSRRRTAEPAGVSTLTDLPYIWKANVPTVNQCTTVEPENPVYPHPGSDVEYGNGMTANSPVTSGDCDEPTPYGATYVKQ